MYTGDWSYSDMFQTKQEELDYCGFFIQEETLVDA